MQRIGRNIGRWLALTATALLVACGGGGGGGGGSSTPTPPTPTYSIGGGVTVTGGGGLAAGLILQLNGAETLPVSSTGGFAFATALPTASAYSVTVQTQPSTQNCVVTAGAGTVAAANVSNVAVACTTVPRRSVGGPINGLLGSGLELRLNGTNSLVIGSTATSAFTFVPGIGEGNPYTVTVATQPSLPTQVCSVVNGTGTVPVGGAIVSNVAVNCALPTPRFAYAASSTNNLISVYTVDPASGTLTFVATVTDGNTTPVAITASSDGRFLMVANEGSDGANGSVSLYAINQVSGTLTSVVSNAVIGERPQGVAIHPAGTFAYVAKQNGGVHAFRINKNSAGVPVSLGNLGSISAPGALNPTSVNVDPTGKFVYVANGSDNVTQFSITTATGSLTFVANTPTGTDPLGLVVDPLGRFGYTANATSGDVAGFSLSATTGALTSIGTPTVAGAGPVQIAIDPLGKFAYVLNNTGNSVSAFSINQTTGELGSLVGGPTPTASGPVAVSVDPAGKFLYVVNSGGAVSGRVTWYEIGPTGTLTDRGFLSVGTNAKGIAVTR